MSFARRRLTWIVVLWLVSQVAGIAAAPVGLCCRTAQAVDDDKCCPGLLPGQVCPMHHSKQEGKRSCKMRSTCAATDAALVALDGGVGILPAATALVSVFDPGISLPDVSSSALSRAFVPESPPPRV
jgi:hypothetical protein